MRFQGEVWRHVPAGTFPLHVGYILKARGRWNIHNEFGCLYTALTKKGAIAEWHKQIHMAGTKPEDASPRDLVTLIVDVQPVLNQTSRRGSLVDPSTPWLTGDSLADIRKCHDLAKKARQLGFQGLQVPSAALKGEKNLVIYVDGISGNVDLKSGKVRIPLNY